MKKTHDKLPPEIARQLRTLAKLRAAILEAEERLEPAEGVTSFACVEVEPDDWRRILKLARSR